MSVWNRITAWLQDANEITRFPPKRQIFSLFSTFSEHHIWKMFKNPLRDYLPIHSQQYTCNIVKVVTEIQDNEPCFHKNDTREK